MRGVSRGSKIPRVKLRSVLLTRKTILCSQRQLDWYGRPPRRWRLMAAQRAVFSVASFRTTPPKMSRPRSVVHSRCLIKITLWRTKLSDLSDRLPSSTENLTSWRKRNRAMPLWLVIRAWRNSRPWRTIRSSRRMKIWRCLLSRKRKIFTPKCRIKYCPCSKRRTRRPDRSRIVLCLKLTTSSRIFFSHLNCSKI